MGLAKIYPYTRSKDMGVPLTVKHILIECTDFRDIRNKYFVASTMKDVFEQVKSVCVMS